MITIDQLLESVDLDFEPRWVTQDSNGRVAIWERKPECRSDILLWYRGNYGTGFYTRLKLAEFEGKDWTECIYEVPRKTTGKIKKLECYELADKEFNPTGKFEPMCYMTLIETINSLVYTVNKHADIIRQIGQWGSSKGECLWCETLTKFEPKELKGANNE